MAKRRKKSKYKHAIIGNKKYYFYKIVWIDPCGDSGHADIDEMRKLLPAIMVTQAYMYKKTNKFLWTFASYEQGDELFSDRNVFPKGCIIKMEKIKI